MEDSAGLFEPILKPLKPFAGAGVGSEGLPNRLEPAFAPVVVLGGGPAGVVELPNILNAGLLVGVVVLDCSAEDLVEPVLLKKLPVLPPPLAPPKRVDVWFCPVVDGSAGLFGVDKLEKMEPPAEDAVPDGWLFCDPVWPSIPPICLFPPPNRVLLPPLPNVGAGVVPEAPPKREFPPAVLVLPNRPVPDVVEVLVVDPNRPPAGFEALEGAEPKRPPELPLVPV